MFQIFRNPTIPFLQYRAAAAGISLLIILFGAGLFTKKGFNYGIDFAGGTQLTLRFNEKPDIQGIRDLMKSLNLGDVVIQEFDEAELNELMIRVENSGEEGDVAGTVLSFLHEKLSPGAGDKDINFIGSDAIEQILAEHSAGREGAVESAVEAIAAYKKEHGVIHSIDAMLQSLAIDENVADSVRSSFTVGSFALMGAENVGPKVGKDLRKKAQLAIVWSIIGMLIYIWIRFRAFSYGLGAIVALFHDVLVTLTFFVLTGREINLAVVAALLTLVGYSVNDTVVVFDRIRENLRRVRKRPFDVTVNQAINETLSRTVITSGTTFMTVLSLYFLGGEVIRNFAFALVVGIIVGTYSSIFIASPVVVFIQGMTKKRNGVKRR